MKIAITGSDGLVGWHLRCYYNGREGVTIVPVNRPIFADPSKLESALSGCDAVVHLAGMNRGEEGEVARANVDIAEQLVAALNAIDSKAHVLFSSSTQIFKATSYGQSKQRAAAVLGGWAESARGRFTEIVMPHIFGERGRPFYNSAIATFCHQIANGDQPAVKVDAELELLHAQDLAAHIDELIRNGTTGQITLSGEKIMVSKALSMLQELFEQYTSGVVPYLHNRFTLRMFNTMRGYLFPEHYPIALTLHEDNRGSLFEAVKGLSGGQTFISTTRPGITRGDHYHLAKVERFLVLQGEAEISIRRLFDGEAKTFKVSGDKPVFIDMPTMHTHNITNCGEQDLLTLFWANEIFDPENPDTMAERV